MSTVDHTHPDTGRPFGDAVVYRRGPTVAADGGESERSEHEPRRSAERSDGGERTNGSRTTEDGTSSGSERDGHEETTDAETDANADADEPVDGERMKDIDHEPPTQAEPNRVFERGTEGRDDAR
ncbi:hypothetical protein [Halococcus qingdaonensis]|uniref:hypothetical protein n=1 Tax=Halococcus qingdaonensis TaxID=224402 RepID=UPI002115F191|nr:hypothetical protein [Halococcus qingdaonensis]